MKTQVQHNREKTTYEHINGTTIHGNRKQEDNTMEEKVKEQSQRKNKRDLKKHITEKNDDNKRLDEQTKKQLKEEKRKNTRIYNEKH